MIDDSDENRKVKIRIHESAAGNAMPSLNNGYYVTSYGYLNNTFSDDIEGFAVSQDVFSDNIFIIKDGKIVKESSDFLNDRKFSVYKYSGPKTLIELLSCTEVSDNYFYKSLSESSIVSKDSLEYDSNFDPIILESISDIQSAIKATIIHQYNEATGSDTMYFPVQDTRIEGSKKDVIGDNTNVDILKDLDGYFILNKDLNQRSKSYPSVEEIPKPVANIMANNDIMREV